MTSRQNSSAWKTRISEAGAFYLFVVPALSRELYAAAVLLGTTAETF